ncbi:protein SRG1 [Amborella trichopoda]|uniref:Fe2OG dioxygenase domain-containing protein n=1 Tax=Amborella trichopoda TaxID=13333 RepID=U5D983_AMBTC|nr:protein SRG1 [Amborella trichopoda]ERN16958.1 hypothetical protein AMTR_s00057p00196790 [Amborella trichopoda]|eukprot:XP_020529726.1 protein SRG1 [Amborella trichopoda]
MATTIRSPQGIKIGHVDDVQELRRTRPAVVPERYVRDHCERPDRVPTNRSTTQVPVIDMSRLLGRESQNELAKLARACEEWGFFQVVNHGVDRALLEKMEGVAKEFFMLPLEEKEKYPMAPGTVQGYGHAFIFSEDQKLDWCNMLALGIHPHHIRNPLLWPKKPQQLSETLETYSMNIRRLCQRLLGAIARSLGLREEMFNEMFGEAVQAVRMNYYPPCPRPDLVLGLSPHSDGSAITVLQQDLGSAGLQIRKGNDWVLVEPLQGALVINIGDTIEVLTNGKYQSIEHRVVTNKEKDRLSIVTFYAPSYNINIGPLPRFIDDKNLAKYRTYNHGDYSRYYVTNKLEGKKSLDFAKIRK